MVKKEVISYKEYLKNGQYLYMKDEKKKFCQTENTKSFSV